MNYHVAIRILCVVCRPPPMREFTIRASTSATRLRSEAVLRRRTRLPDRRNVPEHHGLWSEQRRGQSAVPAKDRQVDPSALARVDVSHNSGLSGESIERAGEPAVTEDGKREPGGR